MKSKLLVILSSVFLMQGCADNASVSVEELSSRDSACVEKVLANKAAIEGQSIVMKDETSSFAVIDDLKDCSHTKSILWDTNDSFKNDNTNNASFKHTYRNAGEYALDAVLVSSFGSVAKISKGIVVDQACDSGMTCLSLRGPLVANTNQDVKFTLEGIDNVEADASWASRDESDISIDEDDGVFNFPEAGKVTIIATFDGQDYSRQLIVLEADVVSEPACDLSEIVLSGPSELHLNEAADVSIKIPACVSKDVTGITWSFSDGQDLKFGQYISVEFSTAGEQKYSVDLILKSGEKVHLSRDVVVAEEECSDCGSEDDDSTDTGGSDDDDDSTDTPIVIIPDPSDLDCGNVKNGTEIFIEGIITGGTVSCGEGLGNKIVTSVAKRVKTCTNGSYVDSVKPAEVTSETACFKWTKTGSTSCTKACGGTQNDIYSCSSPAGDVLSGIEAGICKEMPSADSYVCDGDANFEEIKITETLEKGEPRVCNSNKMGYVVDKETTQEVYRCVNHEVALVDTITTLEEAPFCLDLKRCSDDSLSPSRAHGRLQWMKKCSANDKIENFFSVTKEFKYAPQNSYVFNEDKMLIEGRPTYATFRNKDGSPWSAPAPGTKNWRDKRVSDINDVSEFSCEIPDNVEIVGICMSSCVTPSQRILSSFGEKEISGAHKMSLSDVVTLSPLSTVLKPVLSTTPVLQFVTEVTNSEHDILIFSMASGKTIEYTPNHPVITKEGKLKEAGNFIVGEHFVRKSGELDEVLKIKSVKHYGKVYNVFMESSVLERNVVVINDYLTGSAYFQQEGHDFVDRKILRSLLVK